MGRWVLGRLVGGSVFCGFNKTPDLDMKSLHENIFLLDHPLSYRKRGIDQYFVG